jgi:hypothetical protein
MKDENDDLADSHNILSRRKNYFSQLLNVGNVSEPDYERTVVTSMPAAVDTLRLFTGTADHAAICLMDIAPPKKIG